MKTRDSNIEILRIFAMLGVIILHIINPNMGGGLSYVDKSSVNAWVLFILNSVFVAAVDVFMMISGYYLGQSSKPRSLRKPIRLLVQVSAFRVAPYFLSVMIGRNAFSIRSTAVWLLPVNYFVVLYCATYILSPYINKLLNSLDSPTQIKFVCLILLLFSFEPTFVGIIEHISGTPLEGLNAVGLYGDSSGYTIVNFVMCYVIGTALRWIKSPPPRQKVIVIMLVICILIDAVWLAVGQILNMPISAEKYNNPIVILLAVLWILLFKRWEIKANKGVVIGAQATFTVFLTHSYFFRFFNFQRICSYNPVKMCGAILGVAFLIFAICIPIHWMFDAIYKLAEKFVINMYEKCARKITQK